MRVGILTAELAPEDRRENDRFAEEIENAGHTPVIINYCNAVVAVTKKGRFLCSFDKDGELRVVDVDIVIPRVNEPDTLSVGLSMLVLDILISNGVHSTVAPSAIELAKNKMRSQIAFDTAGIATPYSAAPTGFTIQYPKSLLKVIEEDAKRPIVIKTNTGTHGKGVMVGDSRRSAKGIIEAFATNAVPIIIQEFVETPGCVDTHVDTRLIVVGGQIVAAMKRETGSEEDFRANLSLGGTAMTYRPTPTECKIAIRAAEVIGLDCAGVDVLQSQRGPLVVEVNVSPGLGIERITGVNVAKVIVARALCGARVRQSLS